MPGVGAKFGIGLGNGGPSTGEGLPFQTMYGGGGNAPAHVITGEFVFLIIVELAFLGFIRLSFANNFGG